MLKTSLTALLLACAASAAAAQAPAGTPGSDATLLGAFRDWTAAAREGGGAKMCFAYTQPKSSEPQGVKRDPVYLYITHRPGDGVRNEVSIKIGYPLREDAKSSVSVAGQAYDLTARNDTAWLLNTADEAKLVESMRKARDLTVKGTSRRGTATTDTFSLGGAAQALERISQECRDAAAPAAAKPAAKKTR